MRGVLRNAESSSRHLHIRNTAKAGHSPVLLTLLELGRPRPPDVEANLAHAEYAPQAHPDLQISIRNTPNGWPAFLSPGTELQLPAIFIRLPEPAQSLNSSKSLPPPSEASRFLKMDCSGGRPMRRILLSVFSLLLIACSARADQVVLKNGDRLTGKIVSGDGKTLLLKSEFAGDVTIQWDAITD